MLNDGTGLQQPVPPAVASQLNGDALLLTTSTDLSLSGERAVEWLLVTADQVLVFEDGPKRLHELRVADVSSFRTYAAVGSGFLQAQIDGVWVDLLRYSKSLAERFTKVAKKLSDLKKEGKLEIHADEKIGERCPTCGRKLRFAGEVCPDCIDRGTVVKRVWDLVRPYRWSTIALFALLLIGILISLVPPKLQEYLVDDVLRADRHSDGSGILGSLGAIVLGLALTRVIGAGVGQLKGVISHRIGTELTFSLRMRLVEKLHDLPIAFYDRNQVGMLVSRVAQDTEALYGFLYQLTNGFLLQLLQFIGVGVMLFVINAKLAFYTLIPAPLVIGGSIVFWRYIYPKYYRLSDSSSKHVVALMGMLSGIRVVKAFAQEERELVRFRTVSGQFHDARIDVGNSSTSYGVIMSLVFSLGGLIVWYIGGRDVVEAHMSLGELMAFLAYLSMFYAPLSTLAQLTTWLSSFVASSARVLELLDTPPEMLDPEQPKELAASPGAIRFDGVTFGYDRHQPVLDDVSFEIPRGQMVGIVGKSGSGKTTLVNLICRFYDVQEGRVLIDGTDVRDLSRRALRRRIGIVLQETFLFRGTIWENLIYGQADATFDQAITAAKAAHAHDFIMKMPFGYDTPVGERGVNLSGGERQRMAIARALLYDPAILILDEATSSLDTESEKLIQDALEQVTRGRTTIAIAHRLSTLRHASRILVFDRGKLAEDGSHSELVSKEGGIYANLIKLQSRVTEGASIEQLAAPPEERSMEIDTRAFTPRWLTPDTCSVRPGPRGGAVLEIAGDTTYGGITAALAFPTQPGRWICVRASTGDAPEKEIGIIRSLAEWSDEARRLIEEALGRRYYLNVIEAIDRIELSVGLLDFRVRTKRGRQEFTMRWAQAQAQDYGKTGKVLIDIDENQWLIPEIDRLPKRQQWLFRRYVYW